MTTTGTREPDTGDFVPSWVNQDENEEIDGDEVTTKAPRIKWKAGIPAVVMVLAVLAITFFLTRGDDGQSERQQTRNEALASLEGRFNDPTIDPKVTITRIEWVDNNLMVDWTQGDKRCTSQVIIPKDGGLYGIQPVAKVDPSRWDTNTPHCYFVTEANPLPNP